MARVGVALLLAAAPARGALPAEVGARLRALAAGRRPPLGAPPGRDGTPVTVDTPAGSVRGSVNGDFANFSVPTAAFLGIPYATAARFGAPEDVPAWEGVRDATKETPACPQGATAGVLMSPIAEDCLTANVFAPAGALSGNASLPVLFWVHGGGFTVGSSYSQALQYMFEALDAVTPAASIYDGQQLAAGGDVVIVSVNYRLGALGFLPFGGSPPNLGLLDQQAGLRWVRRVAASFGGDPARVTIFGESAGGESINWHLVSPGSKGLFAGAICESGGLGAATPAHRAAQATAFAAKAGCAGDAAAQLACMRAAPLKEVMKAQGSGMGDYGPTVHAPELPDQPAALLKRGEFARVPLIIGTNRDENSIFGACKNISAAEYEAKVGAMFGGNATLTAAALALYPVAKYPAPRDAEVTISSDTAFCEGRSIASTVAGFGVPVYRYQLQRAAWFLNLMSDVIYGMKEAYYCLGVPHATDLIYVWGTFNNLFGPAPGDLALSAQVQAAWTNFAHGGDPNAGGPMGPLQQPWAPHGGADTVLLLDGSRTAAKLHNEAGRLAVQCDVLDHAAGWY